MQKKQFLHTNTEHIKSIRPHYRERTLSNAFNPCRIPAYAFFAVSFSITSSVAISSAAAIARLSTTL